MKTNTDFLWSPQFKKALENPKFAQKARELLGDELFEITVKIIASEHMINEACRVVESNPNLAMDNLMRVTHLNDEIQTDLSNTQN